MIKVIFKYRFEVKIMIRSNYGMRSLSQFSHKMSKICHTLHIHVLGHLTFILQKWLLLVLFLGIWWLEWTPFLWKSLFTYSRLRGAIDKNSMLELELGHFFAALIHFSGRWTVLVVKNAKLFKSRYYLFFFSWGDHNCFCNCLCVLIRPWDSTHEKKTSEASAVISRYWLLSSWPSSPDWGTVEMCGGRQSKTILHFVFPIF